MVLRASAILTVLVVLGAACGGPGVASATLRSPVPSPRNDCEDAYLAWITAPQIQDVEHAHDQWRMSALEPLFQVCDVAALSAASQRYPIRRCFDPQEPESCSFQAELPIDHHAIATSHVFAALCDGSAAPFLMDLEGTFEQTILCRDMARYIPLSLPPSDRRLQG